MMSSSADIYERVLINAQRVQPPREEPTVVVETTQGDEEAMPLTPPVERVKTAAFTLATCFRSPDAHPILLDLVLLNKYGTAWLEWEIETLVLHLQQDFRTQSVADVNIEKIQACKALHLVDDFWLRWEVFLPCCSAFNSTLADFHVMQIPAVAECMVAVDIANRIRDDVQWSGEIKTYLGVVHRHTSEFCPLPPLDFVSVDTEGLPVDCAEVQRRWPSVRAAGKAPTGATIEDEQLRRMLGSWSYLELIRSRLQSQLVVLKDV